MNQSLSTNSIVFKSISKSTIIPKRDHPLTAKTDKCIKFFKEEKEGHQGQDVNELFNPSLPTDSQSKASNNQLNRKIDLNKLIENEKAYGKSEQKEALDCINSKKKHMLQDDYFSSTVDKYQLIDMQKLPEYFSIANDEELTKQLDAIFETITLDIKKLEGIKQRLSEYRIEKSIGPIGPLASCDSLIIIMNVNNNKAINNTFNEMKNDIKMCRYILNDGNSFYRAFMLGLFEHHILYRNIINIKTLILGIFTNIKAKQLNRHNPLISLHEVTILLYLIYSEVIRNKTKAAHELLLKAINSSRSFDYALIKFMRIAIGEYIESNADFIFKSESWEEIEQIAAPAYLSNHCFDYKNYINDCILAMHYEADKFIIQLSSVVFRINLNLYAIEGTANEVKHLIYLKQNYHYSTNATIDNSISLFYSFARYHILYSIDYIKHNNINITFRSTRDKEVADDVINYRFHIANSNHYCKTCNEVSSLICFNHIPKCSLCKKCLITAIDRIIIKRISHFTDEYFNNKEYYFRLVDLSENYDDKLYEEDFIALFNRNIPQQILYTMERLCYVCFKAFAFDNKGDDCDYETMPCECKICHQCLIDMILKATDQKIVLNQYEKMQMKGLDKNRVYCPCEIVFDVDKATELIYHKDKERIKELSKEAMIRLHKSAEVICSFCGVYHQRANYSKMISLNTNIVKHDYLNVIRFNIIKNSNVNANIAYCSHIICKKCINSLRMEIRNKIQKGEISDEESSFPLDCKVCLYTHKIDVKMLKLNKDKNCCCIY